MEVELRVYFLCSPPVPQHPTNPIAAFTDQESWWNPVQLLLFCRKDQNVLSPVNCWNLLLNQVKRESRDHTTLSDIYLNNIIPRFVQVSEDSGRLFKKVTECCSTKLHSVLLKYHSSCYLWWIHLLGDFFLFGLDFDFFQSFSPVWPVKICWSKLRLCFSPLSLLHGFEWMLKT